MCIDCVCVCVCVCVCEAQLIQKVRKVGKRMEQVCFVGACFQGVCVCLCVCVFTVGQDYFTLIFHVSHINIEGSRPEWCISSMIYGRDTPFWSGTLDMWLNKLNDRSLFALFLPNNTPPPSPKSGVFIGPLTLAFVLRQT